ncbi:MAG TPA: hypothetical protein VF482_14040 [Trebonia sp.]
MTGISAILAAGSLCPGSAGDFPGDRAKRYEAFLMTFLMALLNGRAAPSGTGVGFRNVG